MSTRDPVNRQPEETSPAIEAVGVPVVRAEREGGDADLNAADTALMHDLATAISRSPFVEEAASPPPGMVEGILANARSVSDEETVQRFSDQTGGEALEFKVAQSSGSLREPHQFDFEGGILGGYRVLRCLGEGGMGLVYEAEDTLLKRRVALKLMRPEVAAKPVNRARFLREARAVAKVEHDYICPIYQVGDAEGMPFIAMPLLQGETLEQRLCRQPLLLEESLQVLLQAAEGLAAAHNAGIVHRDIKPSNIWLEARPNGEMRVRLLDFGLARCELDETSMTLAGTVMGTPAYMSPEQARGEEVDCRADLFSLGAVAFEMVSGTRAFPGSGTVEILSRILTHEPEILGNDHLAIPPELPILIRQLLKKNAAERTSSAEELVRDCRRILEETRRGNQSSASPHASPHVSDRFGRNSRGGSRARMVIGLIAAGFLPLLAWLGFLLLQTPNGTLRVEFDESADIRIRGGELQIHDEHGELRYTLSPGESHEHIAVGTYHVNVIGADGLTVSTPVFEMKRGETVVVRVTATPPVGPEAAPVPSPSNTASTEIRFPGKAIILEDFGNPSRSQLPTGITAGETKHIVDGIYKYASAVTADLQPLILQIVPLSSRVSAGAFATRIRATNGQPFINFGSRRSTNQSRYLSLSMKEGLWHLYLARQDLEEGDWVVKPAISVAFDSKVVPELMPGQWIDVAARWGTDDYDLWLNRVHIAGGPLPPDILIGDATALQFCVKPKSGGVTNLELAKLSVWDQTGLAPQEASPVGLPPRPAP